MVADGRQLRLVHRLDAATTGVLVLATSPDAAAWLSAGFRSRTERATGGGGGSSGGGGAEGGLEVRRSGGAGLCSPKLGWPRRALGCCCLPGPQASAACLPCCLPDKAGCAPQSGKTNLLPLAAPSPGAQDVLGSGGQARARGGSASGGPTRAGHYRLAGAPWRRLPAGRRRGVAGGAGSGPRGCWGAAGRHQVYAAGAEQGARLAGTAAANWAEVSACH